MKSKTFVSLLVLVAVLAAGVLTGCGGAAGSKAVDTYLEHLEKSLVQWETKVKSKTFTLYDFGEMNKASVDVMIEGRRLENTETWSSSQQKRFSDVSARLSRLLTQLAANPLT